MLFFQILPLLFLSILLPAKSEVFDPCEAKETTVNLRFCYKQKINRSDKKLSSKVDSTTLLEWKEIRQKICVDSYGLTPSTLGTIHPLIVLRCEEELNKTLLETTKPLNPRWVKTERVRVALVSPEQVRENRRTISLNQFKNPTTHPTTRFKGNSCLITQLMHAIGILLKAATACKCKQ